MVFLIDAAVDVLNTLHPHFKGHSGIFPFQRDDQLYLVGKNAVAVIEGGIPNFYSPNHWDTTLDAYISKPFEFKPEKIEESEKKHLAPICRDADGSRESLAELLEIGLKVRGDDSLLDGRIRMVSHYSRYHSHKHGYAADGVDISVGYFRVMVREEYFDLMRMKELKARETLDTEGRGSALPGAVVITNEAAISFPFPIEFDSREFKRHFRNKSPVVDEYLLRFAKKIYRNTKSPYSFNIQFFPNHLTSSSPEDFSSSFEGTANIVERLKSCYTPLVQAVISEANSLHNSKHAEKIESEKAFRKKIEEKRA